MKSEFSVTISSYFKDLVYQPKEPKLETMIHRENTESLSMALLIVGAAELLFLLVALISGYSFTSGPTHPLNILISAAGCLFFSITSLLYLQRDTEESKRSLLFGKSSIIVLYFLLSAVSMLIDFASYKSGGQMVFFCIVQFFFLLFSCIKPQQGVILLTLTCGCFAVLVVCTGASESFRFASFFFYVLAVFGNSLKYSRRAKYYRSELDLAKKNTEKDIVIAQSGKYIATFDIRTNIMYNDPEAVKVFNIPLEQYDPLHSELESGIILPESYDEFSSFFGKMLARVPSGSSNFKTYDRNGNVILQRADYTLQKDDSGEYVRAIISFSDDSDKMRQNELYQLRITELLALAKDTDFYASCSLNRWCVEDFHHMTDRFIDIPSPLGVNIDDCIYGIWKERILPEDLPTLRTFFNKNRLLELVSAGIKTDSVEFRLLNGDSVEWCLIELSFLSTEISDEHSFFLLFRNINESRERMDSLVISATVDKLTGLYNRDATMHMIDEYLKGDGALGTHALIMLDLDNLKAINDNLGHALGDEALLNVGICMRRNFRQNDICGRIGGDEFFVFLKNISIEKTYEKAKALVCELQTTYCTGSEHVETSASMGITFYHGTDQDKKTLEQLYAEADEALYRAKAMGKNSFCFADELDAFTVNSSASSLLQNEHLSYNLRSLFDNLASGIAIFHGSCIEDIVPVYCNDKLPQLLGIEPETFYSQMLEKNDFFIHPDDVSKAKSTFRRVITTHASTREVFRMLLGSGEYSYLTVLSNAHCFDDGSFDLYCIFSDAVEAEQLYRVQENRQRQLQFMRMNAKEMDIAYAIFNMSQNLCVEQYFSIAPTLDINTFSSVDDYFALFAQCITSERLRHEFEQSFSRESFLADAKNGLSYKEMRVPLKVANKPLRWYHLSTDLSLNPENEDIEVFASLKDVSSEVQLEHIIKTLLESEFEYLCHIDVSDGRVDLLKQTAAGEQYYDEELKATVSALIDDEYSDFAMKALSLERVKAELQSNERYTIILPTRVPDDEPEKLCQFTFEYIDELMSGVLMTCKNISKILEYGYDTLTGQLSRNGFYRKAHDMIIRHGDGNYYLIELDFDGFKFVNERMGYNSGNRVLRRFSNVLLRCAQSHDPNCVLGHFEGDHFVLFINLSDASSPENLYMELNTQISAFPKQYRMPIRMGVYKLNDTTVDIELMCDCAHLAHRASKSSYSKHIFYYSSYLRDNLLRDRILTSELKSALENEQFEVYLQPQINHTAGGELIGAEALVRWQHPTRGLVPPNVFIPLFEQNGAIYELDKYVWEHCCRLLRQWTDEGRTPIPLAINASRVDIMHLDFVSTLISLTDKYRVPRRLLHVEITESVFSEDTDRLVDIVKQLIALGFIVAIDDFGSGYSSLSLLEILPANILKLDMRFFHNKGDRMRNECVLEAVIRMTRMLGMAPLAEGVETRELADLLSNIGCDYIQGYLYSKPLPVNEFIKFTDSLKRKGIELGRLDVGTAQVSSPSRANSLLRNIVSGSENSIMVVDISSHMLLYANHSAEEYYGKSYNPMHPISIGEFCAPHEPVNDGIISELLTSSHVERTAKQGDKFIKSTFSHIDWNGHHAFVLYQTNVSAEHNQFELADSVIKNSPGAIMRFVSDKNSKVKLDFVSDRTAIFLNLAGLSSNLPSYEEFLSCVHPDDVQLIRSAARRCFDDKQAINQDFRFMLKTGSIRWINLRIQPVLESDGACMFYALCSDISDSKNANLRMVNILQSIPAGIAIYEISKHDMRRIFISDFAKQVLELPDSLTGVQKVTDLYSRVHPHDRERVIKLTQAGFNGDDYFTLDFRLLTEKGNIRWVRFRSTPIADHTQNSKLFYSVYMDISSEKQHEREGIDELIGQSMQRNNEL